MVSTFSLVIFRNIKDIMINTSCLHIFSCLPRFSCISMESSGSVSDIMPLVLGVSTTLRKLVILRCCCVFGIQRIGPDLWWFCCLGSQSFAYRHHQVSAWCSSRLHFQFRSWWYSGVIFHILPKDLSLLLCREWLRLWESEESCILSARLSCFSKLPLPNEEEERNM